MAFATALSVKRSVLARRPRSRHGPGPGVKLKKPETVPLNCDELVVPVVFTTTTKFDCAGTAKELEALPTLVPKPTTPLSPR